MVESDGMTFELIATFYYTELFAKLEYAEQQRIEKFYLQLTLQGDKVGYPLAGLPFFREKKFNGKRLYYLVYLEWNAILLAGISDKKKQQTMITQIKSQLDENRIFVLHYLQQNHLI